MRSVKNAKILVGSRQFMEHLKEVALAARESFYVQAMTFEGDAAGEELIDIMIASPADDRRLLIDSFSKVVISDSFVFSTRYLKDSAFRREITQTRALIKKVEQSGVKVRFTNPVGWLMSKYPLRNHKKMMIADDKVAFLGGINFSDHNFEWYDMMIELKDGKIAKCLAQDFQSTWLGKNQSSVFEFIDSSLWLFNGAKSERLYDRFFERIRSARKSVQVISPYVSDPLLSVLKETSAKGVGISIISPEENNKSIFKKNLLSELSKGYFKLLHYPKMFHLKAILIDDEMLFFGSSNYDLVSYYFEQEVVFTTTGTQLVSEFKNAVMKPMLEAAAVFDSTPPKSGASAHIMKMLNAFGKIASRTILKPD